LINEFRSSFASSRYLIRSRYCLGSIGFFLNLIFLSTSPKQVSQSLSRCYFLNNFLFKKHTRGRRAPANKYLI